MTRQEAEQLVRLLSRLYKSDVARVAGPDARAAISEVHGYALAAMTLADDDYSRGVERGNLRLLAEIETL